MTEIIIFPVVLKTTVPLQILVDLISGNDLGILNRL